MENLELYQDGTSILHQHVVKSHALSNSSCITAHDVLNAQLHSSTGQPSSVSVRELGVTRTEVSSHSASSSRKKQPKNKIKSLLNALETVKCEKDFSDDLGSLQECIQIEDVEIQSIENSLQHASDNFQSHVGEDVVNFDALSKNVQDNGSRILVDREDINSFQSVARCDGAGMDQLTLQQHKTTTVKDLYRSHIEKHDMTPPVHVLSSLKEKESRDLQNMVISQIYHTDMNVTNNGCPLSSTTSSSLASTNSCIAGSVPAAVSEYFIPSFDSSLPHINNLGNLSLSNIFPASETDSEVALTLASLGDPKHDKLDSAYLHHHGIISQKGTEIGNISSTNNSVNNISNADINEINPLSACPDNANLSLQSHHFSNIPNTSNTLINTSDSLSLNFVRESKSDESTAARSIECKSTLVLRSRKGRGNGVPQQYHNFPDPEKIGRRKRKKEAKSKIEPHSTENEQANDDSQLRAVDIHSLKNAVEKNDIGHLLHIGEQPNNIIVFGERHSLGEKNYVSVMASSKECTLSKSEKEQNYFQNSGTASKNKLLSNCGVGSLNSLNNHQLSVNAENNDLSSDYVFTTTDDCPVHMKQRKVNIKHCDLAHDNDPNTKLSMIANHDATFAHGSSVQMHNISPLKHSLNPTFDSVPSTRHEMPCLLLQNASSHSIDENPHSPFSNVTHNNTPAHHNTPVHGISSPMHQMGTPAHELVSPTHHITASMHKRTTQAYSMAAPEQQMSTTTQQLNDLSFSNVSSNQESKKTCDPVRGWKQKLVLPSNHSCTEASPGEPSSQMEIFYSHAKTSNSSSSILLSSNESTASYCITKVPHHSTSSNYNDVVQSSTINNLVSSPFAASNCNISLNQEQITHNNNSFNNVSNSHTHVMSSTSGLYYTIPSSHINTSVQHHPTSFASSTTAFVQPSSGISLDASAITLPEDHQLLPTTSYAMATGTCLKSNASSLSTGNVHASTSPFKNSTSIDSERNIHVRVSNGNSPNNNNNLSSVQCNSKGNGDMSSSCVLVPVTADTEKVNLLGQLLKASEHCQPASLIPAGVVNDVIPAVGYRILEVSNLSEMIRCMHVCRASDGSLGAIVIQEQASLREGAVSHLSVICTACQEGTVCATSNRTAINSSDVGTEGLDTAVGPWDINLRVQRLVEEFGITENQVQRMLEILGIFYRPSEQTCPSIQPTSLPHCASSSSLFPSSPSLAHEATVTVIPVDADPIGIEAPDATEVMMVEEDPHQPEIEFKAISHLDSSSTSLTATDTGRKRKRTGRLPGPQVPKAKTLSCSECSLMFVSLNHLKKHAQSHSLSQHTCPYCQSYFKKPYNLREHIKKHENVKYKCEECGREFTDRSSLMVHKKSTHDLKYEFKCPSCPKKFYRSIHFKDHLRVHTREMPFACEICGKRFIWRDSVKKHMETHTAEAKYNCRLCGKWFRWLQGIRQHLQQQHKLKKCDVEALYQKNGVTNHMQDNKQLQQMMNNEQQQHKQRVSVQEQQQLIVEIGLFNGSQQQNIRGHLSSERVHASLCVGAEQGDLAPHYSAALECGVDGSHNSDAVVCELGHDAAVGDSSTQNNEGNFTGNNNNNNNNNNGTNIEAAVSVHTGSLLLSGAKEEVIAITSDVDGR